MHGVKIRTKLIIGDKQMETIQKRSIADSTLDTIKSMLEEFSEKSNKCDNKDIISFAKVVGEEFAHAHDQISRSTSLGFGRKLELGGDMLQLERQLGKINNKFNMCKCQK